MAQASFKQFIYCNDLSDHTYPSGLTATQLVNGTAFTQFLPAFQLGVQAPPGTKFYINNNNVPVIVGYTGLFDLDLTSLGSITSLTFDSASINRIKNNDGAILIVDIAYLGGT